MEKTRRRAGILLHISSLPSKYGIGSVGKGARRFIDFIFDAGLSVWQILPLVPTGYGNSPYQSTSSDAVNPYFIDLENLYERNLLTKKELAAEAAENNFGAFDYERLFHTRIPLLKKAFSRFDVSGGDFSEFVKAGSFYDYALFESIKEKHGFLPLEKWEEKYRKYDSPAVAEFAKTHGDEILFRQFTQFIFLEQWRELKNYASAKNIEIMGDMPLYVSGDSVEMWKSPELFKLRRDGKPSAVAGVPPDAFSKDGQKWGNPVYDWEKMKLDGYSWWKNRIKRAFDFYDILRLDHFRGFDRCFEIPPEDPTAVNGRWEKGPGEEFFADIKDLNIVAEDLGIIDDGVRILRKKTGFPGMKVLEFAFDGREDNEYLPSNITDENSVAYTGTHDNMPLVGFFKEAKSDFPEMKKRIKRECDAAGIAFGASGDEKAAADAVCRLTLYSKSDLAVLPMQDFLLQDEISRMNTPSVISSKNWSYRISEDDLSDFLQRKISRLLEEFKR